MSLFVNVPEEEAFRLMMDYFTSKQMKILASTSPSYIRAEFGSLTSISLNNAKGEVEAEIVEKMAEVTAILILASLKNTYTLW